MATRQQTDQWGRPIQGFPEIANSPPESPMPQRVGTGWGRQETGFRDLTNPEAPGPLPMPVRPEYSPYQGAFAPGEDTQLVSNLRLQGKQDWGSLIKGPQAFQGSGLAALEKATQRGSNGQTPWESLALAKQRNEQGSLLGDTMTQGNQAAAGSRAALIAKAGLRGGAAERLAGSSAKAQAMNAQNIGSQGIGARLGIGGQAETARLGTLQQVSKQQQGAWGTEQSLGQQAAIQNAANSMKANQYDIMNVLKERDAQERAKQFGYGQKVKGYIGEVYGQGLGAIPTPSKGGFPWG